MTWHDHYLHWFSSALFALFAVILMTRGRNYLAACTADCFLKVDDPEAQQRLEAAVQRRVQAEGKPVPLGVWLGWFSIALCVLAAIGADFVLLYAAFCFALTLGVAVVFLQVRNVQPTRVALLSARDPQAVLPRYWFYAAIISALMLLSFAIDTKTAAAALIVMVSALLSIGIAWRLTALPALLGGEDISAEQVIDDRLRFFRSRTAMFLAVAQTFVFCEQRDLNTAQTISYALTGAVCVAFAIWTIRRERAAVRLA
jgi:hypothetical protein